MGLANELDQEKITKGVPGLHPVKYDEEGNIVPPPEGGEDLFNLDPPRVPDMQVPEGDDLMAMQRTYAHQARLQAYNEMRKIKERLAKDGIAFNPKALERAIMMPEDKDYIPKDKEYPTSGQGLMVNPFPAEKKKKKGKKKK